VLPPYQVLDTKLPEVQRVQNQLLAPLNALLRIPLLDGTLLRDVALVATVEKRISHTLGRAPLGWLVVGADAAPGNVYEVSRGTSTLVLKSSTSVTLSLWVF
jgi:hypothetical protein